MPLFQKRHYEWLARFAGEKLTERQQVLLVTALGADNPNFDGTRFIHTCLAASERQDKAYRQRKEARANAN